MSPKRRVMFAAIDAPAYPVYIHGKQEFAAVPATKCLHHLRIIAAIVAVCPTDTLLGQNPAEQRIPPPPAIPSRKPEPQSLSVDGILIGFDSFSSQGGGQNRATNNRD